MDCPQCVQDRKNISANARRVMREESECYPLYQKVEECGKVSGHRVQACFKEWREFASCKRNWIAKERGIVYNRPRAPEKWLEKHPGIHPLWSHLRPMRKLLRYTQSSEICTKCRHRAHPVREETDIPDIMIITINEQRPFTLLFSNDGNRILLAPLLNERVCPSTFVFRFSISSLFVAQNFTSHKGAIDRKEERESANHTIVRSQITSGRL